MIDDEKKAQAAVTAAGNPRRPEGEAGEQMLARMNESHAAVTEWALGFLDVQPTDAVLDIGCGGGATLARLAIRVPEGHLTGIDYSEVSVAATKRYNPVLIETDRLDVLQGSVADMPFADASFDRIVTVESFYFWPDPAANLAEVQRVLRPGGQFLLVADIYDTPELTPEERANIARYELFNPTPEEFTRLFHAAGFREVIVHTQPGETWICVEGRK